MPFIATENLMMEAVKKGGDRQVVHEIIRVASMQATAGMKAGEDCDLVERLAAEPTFGLTAEEIKATLASEAYIGRSVEQVELYLAKIAPITAGVEVKKIDIQV